MTQTYPPIPGNPYYNSAAGLVTSETGGGQYVPKQETAQVAATLALAHELRVANLLALPNGEGEHEAFEMLGRT